YVPVDFSYSLVTTPPSVPSPTPNGTAFITSTQPGTIRNDACGLFGMGITVGPNPITVNSLGRLVAPGNSQVHSLQIVDPVSGTTIASTTVNTQGGGAGAFVYGNLASPITLSANATYYILSQEVSGGDQWYDSDTTVTTTSDASLIGAVSGISAPYTLASTSGNEYVPVDFSYSLVTTPPSVPSPTPNGTAFITSTQPGTIRNDACGLFGMGITVGPNPITVNSLGRLVAPGNSQVHSLQIVDPVSGTTIASTTVNTQGGGAGAFVYGNLASPITLSANATYYILSQEVSGGDQWYDSDTTVTTTSDASLIGAVSGISAPYTLASTSGNEYVPVDFSYSLVTTPPSVPSPTPNGTAFITSTQPGTIRNDACGLFGMGITVGPNPITVNSLGRLVAPGNSQVHSLQIVDPVSGTIIASTTVNTQGGGAGAFVYGNLASPITLSANATYYILSQEVSGGDQWYDSDTTVTTTSDASLIGAVSGISAPYALIPNPNQEYV